jgi:hypothetical protein
MKMIQRVKKSAAFTRCIVDSDADAKVRDSKINRKREIAALLQKKWQNKAVVSK